VVRLQPGRQLCIPGLQPRPHRPGGACPPTCPPPPPFVFLGIFFFGGGGVDLLLFGPAAAAMALPAVVVCPIRLQLGCFGVPCSPPPCRRPPPSVPLQLRYFHAYYQPSSYEEGLSLAISCGREGARLTHSHERSAGGAPCHSCAAPWAASCAALHRRQRHRNTAPSPPLRCAQPAPCCPALTALLPPRCAASLAAELRAAPPPCCAAPTAPCWLPAVLRCRQYHYVLQSLTLWREVQDDMFKLWYLVSSCPPTPMLGPLVGALPPPPPTHTPCHELPAHPALLAPYAQRLGLGHNGFLNTR
jgi:hypothetical protein